MYPLLIVLFILRASFLQSAGAEEVQGVSVEPLIFSNESRIIGGHPIAIESAPWQIALINDGFLECGGSILSKTVVMTAAHCIKGVNIANLKIRAGSNVFKQGGQVRRIEKAVVNPRYNPYTHDHDVAILKLSSPLILNKHVRPVRIASQYKPSSKHATVTGWGVTREQSYYTSRHLRAVRVRIIALKKCREDYNNKAVITGNMICAGALNGGKDACQGDSGGALVENGIQYGIVSFGIGCARPKFPGVYTSVAALRHWIRKEAANI